MKKSCIISIILLTVIALSITVSPLLMRISYEEDNTSLTTAINLTYLGELYDDEELIRVLKEYRESGASAALIRETDALMLSNAGLISYFSYSEYEDEHGALPDDKLDKNSFIILCENEKAQNYLLKAFDEKYNKSDFAVFEKNGKMIFGIYKEITAPEAITFPPEERLFEAAGASGLPIALSLEDNGFVNDNYRELIKKLSEKYDIKYFNPTKHEKVEKKFRYDPEASGEWEWMLSEGNRILVLNETISQLSNQKPDGYDNYIRLSEGRIQRCFKTYKSFYTDRPDYDIGYYQMLNSLADRNIRFFNISQLEDGDDSLAGKEERTQRIIRKFVKRAGEIGFSTEKLPDFRGYAVNLRIISAAAALLIGIMAFLCCFFLFGKRIKKYEIIIIISAAAGIIGAFIFPFAIMLLYSTLFAVASPCFALMASTEFAEYTKKRTNGFIFGILNIIFTIILLSAVGMVMSAILSGLDYYLNTLTFQGVKTSLSAPLLLSGLLFIICERKPEGGYRLRKLPKIKKEDIKPVHIIIGIGVLTIIGIYLLRSGNAKISFGEIWFRNFITEKLIARPRTKEFLFAWPCYVLFLYFIKTDKQKALTALTGVAGSILFASSVNTFCHVFTTVKIMELRVIYGALLGIPIGLAAIGVFALLFKLISLSKNH